MKEPWVPMVYSIVYIWSKSSLEMRDTDCGFNALVHLVVVVVSIIAFVILLLITPTPNVAILRFFGGCHTSLKTSSLKLRRLPRKNEGFNPSNDGL